MNDSVRTATQSRRLSIIPPYEPMDDPHLRRFFQSPIVLDIVRKTLNVDPNNSYKQNGRPSKIPKITKRSQSVIRNECIEHKNDVFVFFRMISMIILIIMINEEHRKVQVMQN